MLSFTSHELVAGLGKSHPSRRYGCKSAIQKVPNQQSKAVVSVAAPQRSPVGVVEHQSLQVNLKDEERAQLNSMLFMSSDRPETSDQPSSTLSTSGRSDSIEHHNHNPQFLPGSKRRVRAPISRRVLNASFYGEYCDMAATQVMVSRIWQRVVGSPQDNPQHNATAPAAATTTAQLPSPAAVDNNDSLPLSVHSGASGPHSSITAPHTDPALAPATTSSLSTSGPQLSAFRTAGHSKQRRTGRTKAAAATVAGVRVYAPGYIHETGDDVPYRAREHGGFPPDNQQEPSTADGGGQIADSAIGGGDKFDDGSDGGGGGIAVTPSRQRVVLYLGPEFELQLPPPPLTLDGSSLTESYDKWWRLDGGAATAPMSPSAAPSWSLSERDVGESRTAPPPRPIRGTSLTSPEVIRSVGGAADQGGGRRQQRQRAAVAGKSKTKALAAATEAEGEVAVSAGTSISSKQAKGGKASVTARKGVRAELAVAAVAEEADVSSQCNDISSATASVTTNGSGTSSSASAPGAAPPTLPHLPAPTSASGRAADPRQLTRQRDLVEVLMARREDGKVLERLHKLATVNRTGITAVNHALQVLGDMGHVHALGRLLTLQVATGLFNEHTYATAFRCMARSGRAEMAMAAFEEACRSGRDLGPVACSTLLHIAAQQRNMRLAWSLFDKMVAAKMTLNRYSYNCMAHLAALSGSLTDAMIVYDMMKAEGAAAASKRPSGGTGGAAAGKVANRHKRNHLNGNDDDEEKDDEVSPDSYTYSALVRAAVASGRGDLLPAVFNEMVAAQRAADRAMGRIRRRPGQGMSGGGGGEGSRISREVWGHFITAAGRTGQPLLARRFFEAGIWELGLSPSTDVYNTLLTALARARPFPEVLEVYREMVEGCHRPLNPRAGYIVLPTRPYTPPPGGPSDNHQPNEWQESSITSSTTNNPTEPHTADDDVQPNPPAAAVGSQGAVRGDCTTTVRQAPLTPDPYTFNALLTAAANHMARLATLERIRFEMAVHGVRLNTHIGTALINALRRTPEISHTLPAGGDGGSAAAADHAVHMAEDVMTELLASGAANVASYISMAAFYAAARRPVEVLRVVRDMLAAGLTPECSAWRFLITAAEDADLYGLAGPLTALMQQHAPAGPSGGRGRERREMAGAGGRGGGVGGS